MFLTLTITLILTFKLNTYKIYRQTFYSSADIACFGYLYFTKQCSDIISVLCMPLSSKFLVESIGEKIVKIDQYLVKIWTKCNSLLFWPTPYRMGQKSTIFVHHIILPNINRFSKFFHRQNQETICNKIIIIDTSTPQVCHYTTL